ncbi:hypothetical protein OG535_05990 [Kitasatospora sp. NBC_00085]|uniref:hypothetical protein n=1 Tax=unclassified Kitasatospora TaxID=2633591 RepID=UPI003248AEB6
MPKTSVGVNVHDQAVDAVYELVISVDVRKSGAYNDAGKTRMRRQLYAVLDRAFAEAGVPARAVHREDRGDGILAAVGPTVPPARILGVWVTEVHEQLRRENPDLRMPLGLRVGLHVGPVTHDAQGISGHAVDLACRLTDSAAARLLLERDRADLVVVVSDSLYREVVRHGGRFVDPGDYAPADLRTKDGATPAWVRLPGRPRPAQVPDGGEQDGGEQDGRGQDAPDRREPAEYTLAAPLVPEVREPQDVQAIPEQTIVHGDVSVHRDNTYQGPVHIGRTTGGAHRG